MLKRLDSLDVATSDLADAASIYEKNFGFRVTKSADGKSASVKVGSAIIRLASGDSAIAVSGEGMIGLWLEADDVDQVVASLHRAGLSAARFGSSRAGASWRSIRKLANQVPLFIFDHKA